MARLSIHPESLQFVDEHNRVLLFRGLNVVYKQPPYHPDVTTFGVNTSFCEADVDLLASLGLNVIRLNVSWAALEPERGSYKLDYLDKIRKIVRMCARREIYTLLEFHQDVLCEQLCGHGTPSWFYRQEWTYSWMKFPWPLRWRPFAVDKETGLYSTEETRTWKWYLGYLTWAGGEAWQRFYDNDAGLMDSFAGYWRCIAENFKDEPYVLGYELINEPWLGNIYRNPLLLLPGYAGKYNVQRLITAAGKAIRQVDPRTPIFISDPTLDIYSGLPSVDFPHSAIAIESPRTVDGSESAQPQAGPAVLAYHYYRPPHRISASTFMEAKINLALRLGGGTFLTEFELWPGPPSPAARLAKYNQIREVLEAADLHLQSWVGWSYKTFSQPAIDHTGEPSWDGSLFDPTTRVIIPDVERFLSRPYAMKVAGSIRKMRFDEKDRVFELEFVEDVSCTGPTVIFVQKQVWYPDGFEVVASVSDNGEMVPVIDRKSAVGGARYIEIATSITHQTGAVIRVRIVSRH